MRTKIERGSAGAVHRQCVGDRACRRPEITIEVQNDQRRECERRRIVTAVNQRRPRMAHRGHGVGLV